MNALLPVMDRIVYITDGRAASGTTEEVVRSEVLSKLYGHHVDVLKLHGRVLVVAEPGAEAGDIPDHPHPHRVLSRCTSSSSPASSRADRCTRPW